MVTIVLPSMADTGMAQERTASPSTCTVQDPQAAMPQPYLVPVRPSCSRSTHNNGVSGSTSTSWALPLTKRLTIRFLLVSRLTCPD